MTWEPTDEEVKADIAGRVEYVNGTPRSGGDWESISRAGLRAAYAKLEERLSADKTPGEPTVQFFDGPPIPLESVVIPARPRPLVHYAEAKDINDANLLAEDGWRLLHVYGPRDAPRYVMERERPSTSDGGG